MQKLERVYFPDGVALRRRHGKENTLDNSLLEDAFHGLVFGSLHYASKSEEDIAVHSSCDKQGFLPSTIKQQFPKDLLEHASNSCKVSAIVLGGEENPIGKILAFLTSSWTPIHGQSQLRAIRFEEILLRIEMVLHPSLYHPSREHHTPLDDVKAVGHSNHRDTKEKKTICL